MDRRTFIGSLAAIPAAASAAERVPPSGVIAEQILLWEGSPPNIGAALPTLHVALDDSDASHRSRILTGIAQPALYVARPSKPDGSALLIVPGGGYRELGIDVEGFDIAARFASAGVTCFILVYRLPSEGWVAGRDVPLQDAQRAMRLIRANSSTFRIDADRIGAIGFSAGGHLAATLCERPDAPVYGARDGTDLLSAKPAFAALFYPVITMLLPYAHEASREALLGAEPSAELRSAYSCERLVTRETPPMFLVAALDDDYVSPENTLLMFTALRTAQIPVEMHLFEHGGHGFGLRDTVGLPVAAWPDLLLQWGTSRRFFGPT
ncbi:MAG: alpha/beta hydrolase [Rhizomicrobium sp.]